ncbi:MAG: T9SS type A sorting domain-containing protein [Syntrophothermus sp.]
MKKMFMVFWFFLTILATAQTLSNMYFLNEDIGWIQVIDSYSGKPLNSYKTTNDGMTWAQLDSQYNYLVSYCFTGLQFFNDSIGFLYAFFKKEEDAALYYGKNLYKTVDKGESWQLINDSIFAYEIYFADEKTGYAHAKYVDYGLLLKTVDGGITWDTVGNGVISDEDWEVVTKDKLVNIYERLWYKLTTDGGITWLNKGFSVGIPVTGSEMYAIDLEYTDSLHGFVTVETGDPSYGNYDGVCHTTDGGETWTYTRNYMSGHLSMKDSLNGIQWVTNQEYHLTNDGFKTYTVKQRPSYKVFEYFYYGCEAIYACGDSGYFAKSIDCGDTWTEIPFVVLNPTEVNENNTTITNYSLEQNYPNPFNPSTRINYNLLSSGMTTIKVYDVVGKEIATLINEYQTSGSHYVDYNSKDLNSGVYFYKINSGEFTEVKKMVFIK